MAKFEVSATKQLLFNIEENGFDIDIINSNDNDYNIIREICSKHYDVTITMCGEEDEDDLFYRYDDYTRIVDELLYEDINKLSSEYNKSLIRHYFEQWVERNSIFNSSTLYDWEWL